MTDKTTKEPEINPAETAYVAGTPQFEKMKEMALEAAKHRLRETLKSAIVDDAKDTPKIGEALAVRAAPILQTFASMMDMPLEQQALTQFACMTQSGMDCMIRASAFEDDEEQQNDRWSRRKAAPAGTQRTQRHVELEIQSRMAASSALLLDALTRMRNNGCHQITFSHLQPKANPSLTEPMPVAPAVKRETVEERANRIADMGADLFFYGMGDALDQAYSPSPAES